MPEWQKRLFISNARRSGGDTLQSERRLAFAESPKAIISPCSTMLVDMEAIKSTVKRGVDIIEAFLNVFHGARLSCHGLR